MGLRCVINRIPDVAVMKRHDCVIGSRTGLRMMMFSAGVLAVLLACAGMAAGATWVVDDGGGADFVSIQAAVGAASEGDSIKVWGGSYNENVDEESTSFNTLRRWLFAFNNEVRFKFK